MYTYKVVVVVVVDNNPIWNVTTLTAFNLSQSMHFQQIVIRAKGINGGLKKREK